MSRDFEHKFSATCICNNCSGGLDFDPMYVGKAVQCPHCGKETVLLIPEAAGVTVYLLMAAILLWRPEGLFRRV